MILADQSVMTKFLVGFILAFMRFTKLHLALSLTILSDLDSRL